MEPRSLLFDFGKLSEFTSLTESARFLQIVQLSQSRTQFGALITIAGRVQAARLGGIVGIQLDAYPGMTFENSKRNYLYFRRETGRLPVSYQFAD